MKPQPVETRSLSQLVPAAVDIAWLDRCADGRGEDEPPETITQYRAHVSVAYINAPGPAQPIVGALQGARPEPVTTALDSASILTFHRDNRMYEWTAATRLPIG